MGREKSLISVKLNRYSYLVLSLGNCTKLFFKDNTSYFLKKKDDETDKMMAV